MDERLAAVLWDVDGTLAETEFNAHLPAFNGAFADAGLPWHWDQDSYRSLLRVSGGRERMASFLVEVEGGRPSDARIEALMAVKQTHYETMVRSGALALRSGVAALIEELAMAGVTQAIVTTSSRTAVAALMSTLPKRLQSAFIFWVCGEDVASKKPDPEGYAIAIERLKVPARQILAIEDSPHGLAAAVRAGLSCLVTLSSLSRHEPLEAFVRARAVVDCLENPRGCSPVRLGPPCSEGKVTLSWLQGLLLTP